MILRPWTLGVFVLGLTLARCDFGIDTTGLAGGDGQAPDDATSDSAPQDDGATDASAPVDDSASE